MDHTSSNEFALSQANFLKSQEEANTFMAKTFRQIPAHAFYTALPQLISRIIHDDVRQHISFDLRNLLSNSLIRFILGVHAG
jgi:hypothetical protein